MDCMTGVSHYFSMAKVINLLLPFTSACLFTTAAQRNKVRRKMRPGACHFLASKINLQKESQFVNFSSLIRPSLSSFPSIRYFPDSLKAIHSLPGLLISSTGKDLF